MRSKVEPIYLCIYLVVKSFLQAAASLFLVQFLMSPCPADVTAQCQRFFLSLQTSFQRSCSFGCVSKWSRRRPRYPDPDIQTQRTGHLQERQWSFGISLSYIYRQAVVVSPARLGACSPVPLTVITCKVLNEFSWNFQEMLIINQTTWGNDLSVLSEIFSCYRAHSRPSNQDRAGLPNILQSWKVCQNSQCYCKVNNQACDLTAAIFDIHSLMSYSWNTMNRKEVLTHWSPVPSSGALWEGGRISAQYLQWPFPLTGEGPMGTNWRRQTMNNRVQGWATVPAQHVPLWDVDYRRFRGHCKDQGISRGPSGPHLWHLLKRKAQFHFTKTQF